MLGEKPYFPELSPKRKHHGGSTPPLPPPPPSTEAYMEDLSNDLHGLIRHSLLPPRLKYEIDEIDEIEPLLEVTPFCFDEWTPPPDMSNVDERFSAPAVDEWTTPPPDMSYVDERFPALEVDKWTADPISDILIPSPSPRLVGAGIENLAQTCFMAAILQCLTHTGQLFLGLRYSSHDTPCHVSGFCVICAFREHNDQALDISRKTIYLNRFFQNLKYFSADFRPYNQNDAHKFMICALDKLKDAFPKDQNNLIEQIFRGKIVSKLRCCSCGFSCDTIKPIFDFGLAVENVSTVQSALESYIMVESMDAMSKCSSCDQEVYMEKQLLIDKAPDIAVLHLKRFKSDGVKIESRVNFAMNLDLEPYTSPKGREHAATLMYDLYAVVVCRGSTIKSGHYVSYVRSDENTWHLMNDSKVISVSEDVVLAQQAYLLFYAKHGTPWFSSVVKTEERDLQSESMDNTQDFANADTDMEYMKFMI